MQKNDRRIDSTPVENGRRMRLEVSYVFRFKILVVRPRRSSWFDNVLEKTRGDKNVEKASNPYPPGFHMPKGTH